MGGIFNIFSLISLFYLFRALQIAARIWRQWSELIREPLTRAKQQLADDASFFIAVPPGVFVHELGHALAVWWFGGEVVQFGYRVFWGFVLPQGNFTPSQEWFISLAGQIGSVGYGLLLWLLLRRSAASSLRYFALRAFRFQMHFTFIYYPVLTVLLSIGDWRTIYDFGETPLLSGMTAVIHIIVLVLFFIADRRGWFEMPAFANEAEQAAFRELAHRIRSDASFLTTEQVLSYVETLRRGGAVNKANYQLKQFLEQHPNSAAGHLQLATIQLSRQRNISPTAVKSLEKALQLGLSQPRQLAFAHQILGQYHLNAGQGAEAAVHLDKAIGAVADGRSGSEEQLAHLHHLRSQAYRRQQKYDLARQDIHQAIAYARKTGDDAQIGRYQNELDVLEQHAKRR